MSDFVSGDILIVTVGMGGGQQGCRLLLLVSSGRRPAVLLNVQPRTALPRKAPSDPTCQ